MTLALQSCWGECEGRTPTQTRPGAIRCERDGQAHHTRRRPPGSISARRYPWERAFPNLVEGHCNLIRDYGRLSTVFLFQLPDNGRPGDDEPSQSTRVCRRRREYSPRRRRKIPAGVEHQPPAEQRPFFRSEGSRGHVGTACTRPRQPGLASFFLPMSPPVNSQTAEEEQRMFSSLQRQATPVEQRSLLFSARHPTPVP
jgi:hypothetical protein